MSAVGFDFLLLSPKMCRALAVVLVAIPMFTLQAASESSTAGLCMLSDCYTIRQGAADFDTASGVCGAKGGHLMTVRSTVQRDIISILNDNLQGRFWIGLELPAGRCSDPSKELHGYRWVTGEETTDFTEWRAQNSSECGRRCVSVSKDQLWEESSCLEAADGFLCEYNFNETCQAPEMEGFSFTYHTPLGFQATDTAHLPPGTVAIMSPAGYKLYCDINEWKPGPWDCQHENGGCSHTCDMEGGNGKCICPEGLQLEKNQVTCEAPDPCRSHHCAQVCVPQKDSYSCLCRGGYDLDQDGLTCVDVDECKQERACKSDQLCVNTPGSFTCVCPSGFEMVDGECEDTDECESTPCEHHCTNTHGGFECSCFEGFRLNEYDKTTCYSVCEEETCEAMCDPNNRDVCECPEGYILHMEEDTNVCIDIDECDMEMFCQQLCKNSFGSYTCYCEDGYKLEADNYTCTEVPDTEDGSGLTSITPFTEDSVTPTTNITVTEESVISAGALLGILIGVLVTVILGFCVVHREFRQRAKWDMATDCKIAGLDGDYGLQQVTTEKYVRKYSFITNDLKAYT
ncbi:thrombomodulin-like [Erpetoichthys calabaricus]|uniref:thrombomodulin-like n=1 Tax=Erpetoichthys calabaricus TaxID=27687 RepID=UPI002233F431|nr:thrombomodulin-like [Erpetoichthys calabaricus]